ncbi:MAG: PilN domain-containing protein [Proteobacteria bacterium]|nr:PilN domain-containing protein [Pseudomonadota bacterium]
MGGTGVNLIDQLRESQQQESLIIEEQGGGGGRGLFSFLKRKPSSGGESVVVNTGTQMDSRDRAQLLLLIIGLGLVFGSKTYLTQELAKKTAIKQAQVAELQQAMNTEKQKAERLKSIREEMLKFDEQVATLQRKIQKIEDLSENRNYIVRSTDFLVSEMPANVWLTKLTSKRGADGEVSLEGYSMSLQSVSEFMQKLEATIFFPNWNLQETTNEGTKPSDVNTKEGEIPIPLDAKKFSVKAKLVEPQP